MLRLQIIATGKFLVMDKDTTVTTELNSTLFNDQNEFLGSLSYDGKLPLQPNRSLLQYKHYINTPLSNRSLSVMMWLGSTPYKQVQFNYYIEDEVINYTLLIDNGIIANTLKTLKLNKIAVDGDDDQISPGGPQQLADYMLLVAKAAPGAYPMIFAPYKNDGAFKTIDADSYSQYPDISFPVNSYINAWDSLNQKFIVDLANPQSQNQTPFFFLTYVLQRVIVYFGFTPGGKWLTDPDANRIVVHSQVAVNLNIIASSYTYMPAVAINEFLNTVRDEFGLLIDFDETTKVCTIESLDYLVANGQAADLQDSQLKGYREIPVTTTGYLVNREPDDKDQAFSDSDKINLPQLSIGDGSTTVTLSSVPTKMLVENGPVANAQALWKIPYIKQELSPRTPFDQISDIGQADRNNFKLRFLYWHGMVADGAGYLYPYVSADNTDFNGNQISGFTLELTSADTAVQSLNNKYNFLLRSKPYEQALKVSKRQLLSIKPNTIIVTRDFNNAAVYNLLDQLAADITDNDLIMAKATLYPIVWPNNVSPAAAPLPPPPPPPPPPVVDNGVVFAKLIIKNHQSTHHPYPPPEYTEAIEDLYVHFFADQACTQPKNVINLPVRYQVDQYYLNNFNTSQDGHTYSQVTVVCNGSEAVLKLQAPQATTQGGFYDWDYTLMPSALYTIIL